MSLQIKMATKKLLIPTSVVLIATIAAQLRAAESIRIDSPKDYEVFQRDTRIGGRVLVRGQLSAAAGRVQVRFTGKPLEGPLPAGWREAKVNPSGGFTAELPTSAGGWYEMELRIADGEKVVATAEVKHVGVGEVFVIAGQSNSTNYGSEKQKPRTGLVSSFDGSTWQPADDPQPGTQDHSRGGSFLPAFGDAIADRYHVPVGLASCGAGATSVRQWLMKGAKIEVRPTTDRCVKSIGPNQWECTGQLYDGLLKRIGALGPRGCRALLWHQGESDAGQAPDRQITGDQYRALLETIIRSSRKDAGWDVPWMVAQATYHGPQDPANAEFRAAQKGVCDDGLAIPGPDTDALGADYRAGVHFNARGLTAHGLLWAGKIGTYLDRVLDSGDAPSP
jgi:hypothetical protein